MILRKIGGSLFLRLALLVILTVVATQLITWWIVVTERRELIAKQFYGQVVDTLADFEGRLDSIPPAKRAAFLADYNRPWLTQLQPAGADKGLVFSSQLSDFESLLTERLGKELGTQPSVKVRILQDRRQLWIGVHVLGAPYWLIVPMGRFRDHVIGSMSLAALLASLCAILVASAIAWRTTMPIRRVVKASGALSLGHIPEPLNEHIGSSEIRALTAGFNRMAHSLEAAASERRLMLAGLSHDLRTPLTRLKLMVELQGENADSNGMLSDIDEMSGIVRQFIDFARSEEKPRSEPVALAELASSVVARFRREHLDLHLSVSAEPEIVADPLALERLLSNLIDNARRYGQPPVEILVGCDETHAVLSVIDHGSGIPAELRQAALAPFERLAAHRGTDGGSGLGLAIVSRIVNQHQGSLTFADTETGGFKVVVRLPLPTSA
ncbi:ATP-binding protein [Paludibacterium purpuratum]|uniref:histidine kinase n=1 Tax=Paludibacterium purpuratum TaxID=1144873 RepID=A0A4R7AXT4_9NEIS|nr:ATP-binding protein [Paludibacterium purpuratum]TDR72512.1 two-component system osmolarity sensor histidine kinase EnvZ [Paludibacterium purpuratum]